MATFKAFCDDAGAWAVDDAAALTAHIQAKHTGREFLLQTKPMPRRQGTQQLRYLRGVVVPDIARACGYPDPDDWQSVYDALMWKFRRLPDGLFGEPRRQSASKETMSLDELRALIDEFIIYAESSIPGCVIRRPENVDLDGVYDPEWS